MTAATGKTLVWLVDPAGQHRILGAALQVAGFDVQSGGLQVIPETALAVVVDESASADLPAGGLAVPVVMLSGTRDFATRLSALHAGIRFTADPTRTAELVSVLEGIRARRDRAPSRVLIVNDDAQEAGVLGDSLQRHGMQAEVVPEPAQVAARVAQFRPDLILMDMAMPECGGIELAGVIRQNPAWMQIPIIFLASGADPATRRAAMTLGAEDVLSRPIAPDQLVCTVTVRIERARELRAVSARLQHALRELENQKLAFDAHAIVSMADVAGRIIYVNDRFCAISGYARAELLGQNHRILNSGLHPPAFFQNMWKTIASGRIWQGEIRNRRKDGSHYWVESTIVPMAGADGRPDQYISIRTDITGLMRVQANLAEAQRIAQTGSWEWDLLRGQFSWSDEVFRILDLDPQQAVPGHEAFLAAVYPEDRALLAVAEERALRGEGFHVEHRIVRPDGSIRWVAEEGEVEFDARSRPVFMRGTMHDITARRRSEDTLRLSEERLRYSQAFANIGTWDWNIRTGELYWSERIAPLFGYSEGRLDTTYENFLKAVHPDDRQKVVEAVSSCVERGVEYNIEHRVVWPDGTERWAHERGDVIRDADGRPLRMLGVVQDITRRKHAEDELRSAREEAERANQAKSQFLSSMSHELRTPLNAILGFAQLLDVDPDRPLTTGQKEGVAQIQKAGWHLLSLINDILDLSKIEAGAIQLSMEDVALVQVVGECRDLVTPLAAARAITLHFDATADCTNLHVHADATRLKQVVLNLLSNAVKYNREGGSVHIRCSYTPDVRMVRVSVTDSGAGLTPEQLATLFEPFNRLGQERSRVEGTGIGLVITRRLIERMGGRIGVDSAPGAGSTFWVELPRSGVDAAAAAEPEVAAEQRVPVAGRRRVLYIEDNPINMRLVQQILANYAALELLNAHTGELGLSLARRQRPDLVLLDINLPGMDGYELLAQLRAHPETRAIPVIAISANAMPGDVRRGREAGFRHYLTKPLDIKVFMDVVHEALAQDAAGETGRPELPS